MLLALSVAHFISILFNPRSLKPTSSGNATSLNTFDSCYISGDTTINGTVYSKLVQPDFLFPPATTLYLRDSLHYIVDQNGQILFSSEDFTSVFSTATIMAGIDTICTKINKMQDKDVLFNTPAGTFTTSDCSYKYYFTPAWSGAGSVRQQHHRYAKNIGLVSETLLFFVSDPYYKERRLIRYHLQ